MKTAQLKEPVYSLETLTNRDFVKTSNAGSGAVLETIAQHRVPRGEARRLKRHPGRLTLGAKDAFDGDGATQAFVVSNDIVLNPKGFGSEQPAVVYINGVKKTYTAGAPGAGEFAIDYATNTITTGDVPAIGVDNVEVYYPFSEGTWTVEVFSPNERRHETYANGTVRALNARSQDDVNSVFEVNQDTPFLPQDVLVRVQVKSTGIVDWSAVNPFSQIELPFNRKPLASMSAAEVAQANKLLGA